MIPTVAQALASDLARWCRDIVATGVAPRRAAIFFVMMMRFEYEMGNDDGGVSHKNHGKGHFASKPASTGQGLIRIMTEQIQPVGTKRIDTP